MATVNTKGGLRVAFFMAVMMCVECYFLYSYWCMVGRREGLF